MVQCPPAWWKKFPRAVPQAVMTTAFRHAFQIINHWLPFIHRHNEDESPPETPNGARTRFTTTHYIKDGTLKVYLNGVRLIRDTQYVKGPGCKQYTLTRAPRTYSGIDPETGEYTQTVIQHEYIIDD